MVITVNNFNIISTGLLIKWLLNRFKIRKCGRGTLLLGMGMDLLCEKCRHFLKSEPE